MLNFGSWTFPTTFDPRQTLPILHCMVVISSGLFLLIAKRSSRWQKLNQDSGMLGWEVQIEDSRRSPSGTTQAQNLHEQGIQDRKTRTSFIASVRHFFCYVSLAIVVGERRRQQKGNEWVSGSSAGDFQCRLQLPRLDLHALGFFRSPHAG
jgi:hypothetical protein